MVWLCNSKDMASVLEILFWCIASPVEIIHWASRDYLCKWSSIHVWLIYVLTIFLICVLPVCICMCVFSTEVCSAWSPSALFQSIFLRHLYFKVWMQIEGYTVLPLCIGPTSVCQRCVLLKTRGNHRKTVPWLLGTEAECTGPKWGLHWSGRTWNQM